MMLIKCFLAMQLQKYADYRPTKLSGGNKRKLCTALALIGNPSLQFFDEPSSGMDPLARKGLWRCLKLNKELRDGGVVFTTHSLPEAESLCDKIGILVNGEFKCFGSVQHLKQKYSEGYRLTVQKRITSDLVTHSEVNIDQPTP